MFSNKHVPIVALVFVAFILLIGAGSAFAQSPTPDHLKHLRQVAERIWHGEAVTPAEQAEVNPYLQQFKRERAVASPPLTRPTSIDQVDSAGGPDGFGYLWMDNREAGGPTFSWVDIQSTGTTANISGDDPTSLMLPIGFSFPFYGRTFTNFTVSVDGFISFSSAASGFSGSGYFWDNTPLPSQPRSSFYDDTTAAPFMICAFWDDLYTGTTNNVKYQNVNGDLVVQWIDNTFYTNVGHLAFEMILSPTGTIKFQYDSLMVGDSSLNSATIGIQDSIGTNGLQICYDSNPNNLIAEGRAFLIYQLGQASTPSPANNETAVVRNGLMLSWSPAAAATSYSVLLDSLATTPTTVRVTGDTLTNWTIPWTLQANTVYRWQVVASNGSGTNAGPIWTFTTGANTAPPSPSGGTINPTTDATTASLHLHWTSNSGGSEAGFVIFRSDDGIIYAPHDSVASGTVVYIDTLLSANTQYFYRVYAKGTGVYSGGYASANGYTHARTPGLPSLGTAGVSTIPMSIDENTQNGNPLTTQYAIYDSVLAVYFTASGQPGTTTPVWQTIGQWGSPVTLNGLLSTTTYYIQLKASNGSGIATPFGPTASITTVQFTLTLLHPNGGDTLVSGRRDTVRWNPIPYTGTATIKMTTIYPFGNWTTIAANVPLNVPHCTWIVPYIPTDWARVAVVPDSFPELADTSDDNFSIVRYSVGILHPNGGETLYTGTQDTLLWMSNRTTGNCIILYTLAYNPPTTVWTTLASNVPLAQQQYVWTVPNQTTTSARVRIIPILQAQYADSSDANFTIAHPSVQIVHPNGGESLMGNVSDTIRFLPNRASGTATVRYNADYPGGIWTTVGTIPSLADARFVWITPNAASSTSRIAIVPDSYPSLADTSDGNFGILFNSVPSVIGTVPTQFAIAQTYPNPFNGEVNFTIAVPVTGNLQVVFSDLLGRKISELYSGSAMPGYLSLHWKANQLASGEYLLVARFGQHQAVRKVVYLK